MSAAQLKTCQCCGTVMRRDNLKAHHWKRKLYCGRSCALAGWRESNNADIRGGRNGGTARAAALSDAKPSVPWVSILAGRTYRAFEMKRVEV